MAQVSNLRAPGGWRRHPSVVLGVILTAQLMVVLDATIVNVALPHIQRSLGFSKRLAVLGVERLRAHLRGPAPPRCPLGRPARPAPDLHGGDRPVFLELAGRRARHRELDAPGRPRPARGGGRAGCAGGAGPPDNCLPGRGGPGKGYRVVHDRLRRRRRYGPGRRWPPHPVGVLALGNVRQRPYRPCRAPRWRRRASRD